MYFVDKEYFINPDISVLLSKYFYLKIKELKYKLFLIFFVIISEVTIINYDL